MDHRWTEEQEKAIYAPIGKYNILVSADAGSGKTAVLVERICNMIINRGISVENLLVVTFTNAAAAGMKSRIINRLQEQLKEAQDEELKGYLREQIHLCAVADIMTIDSFCMNVLKNNFHLAGITPDFYIIDKTEEELLKSRALEEMFDFLYNTDDEKTKKKFYKLIDTFTDNRSDDKLVQVILDIHKYAQSFAEPMNWVEKSCEYYADAVTDKTWFEKYYIPFVYKTNLREIRDKIKASFKGIFEDICETQYVFSDKAQVFINKITGQLKNVVDIIEEILNTESSEEIFKIINSISFEPIETRKKDLKADIEADCLYISISEILKKARSVVLSFPYKSIEQYREETHAGELSFVAKSLAWIIREFDERLEKEKEKKNAWSFSDIEHKVYELFSDENSGINKRYSQKYVEILIDEYQDTNSLQDSIFKSISRNNRNIFMVGDLKQSIYRFRGGDPYIFKKKFNEYEMEVTEENQDTISGRLLMLSKNFRSSKEVLKSVDEQFEKLMTANLGDVSYKCNFNLPIELNEDLQTEICPIVCIKSDDEEEEELNDIRSHAEARYIAKRIRGMVGTEIKISDAETKVLQYSDFTILSRAVKAHAAAYTEEFKNAGIPLRVTLADFFDKREIKVMISLLKLMSNFKQDIPLLAVLLSPVFGFTNNELAYIKCFAKENIKNNDKKLCLFDTLCQVSKYREKNQIALKCAKTVESLRKWREYGRIMSVAKHIWTIYEESGFYDYMGAFEGTDEAQRNLRLLYERALTFEKGGSKGLFNFVKYLESLKANEEDLSSAKTASGNSVSMMTIHASKGLEFPVVFLAGLGQKLKSPNYASINCHKDLGIGIPYGNIKNQTYEKNIYTEAIRELNQREEMSELVRLLYVAMTRAQYKLIEVVAYDVKSEEDISDIYDLYEGYVFSDYDNRGAEKFLQWVISAAASSNSLICHEPVQFDDIAEEIEEKSEEEVIITSDLTSLVKKLLDFEYQYQGSTDIPSRTSATELKRVESIRKKRQVNVPKKPKFMSSDITDGTKRGTAYHNAIAFISLEKLRNELTLESVDSELKRLAKIGKINEKIYEKDKEMAEKIYKFFAECPLGIRILELPENKIYREKNFQIAIKAATYKPRETIDKNEEMILQGVIDCFYIDEEKNEVVLIDYKTDSLKSKTKEEILDNYDMQLRLYTEAIEKITGYKVTHRYLYLFDINEAAELI